MNDIARRQLQRLQQHPDWAGFEVFFEHFMLTQFISASVKRDSNFETIWQAAYQEGGKEYLREFYRQLEEEAKKV